MSKELQTTHGLAPDQLELIKATIAKNATNDELKLFLYRCKAIGLDPLKPGQIYFVKYGNMPGTIVIGLDGFRSLAGRTGKHCGTSRGLMLDKNDKCIGAWAEVYRSDWAKPARTEVYLDEYDTNKAMWQTKKKTMILKVAEVAALRMAFPDDIGGMYSDDEIEVKTEDPKAAPPKTKDKENYFDKFKQDYRPQRDAVQLEPRQEVETQPQPEVYPEPEELSAAPVAQEIQPEIPFTRKYEPQSPAAFGNSETITVAAAQKLAALGKQKGWNQKQMNTAVKKFTGKEKWATLTNAEADVISSVFNTTKPEGATNE